MERSRRISICQPTQVKQETMRHMPLKGTGMFSGGPEYIPKANTSALDEGSEGTKNTQCKLSNNPYL